MRDEFDSDPQTHTKQRAIIFILFLIFVLGSYSVMLKVLFLVLYWKHLLLALCFPAPIGSLNF